jgi:pantetheine-phosphate adenylyltransferase
MRRIAFFPGSFDPITKGHEDIVRRSISMFEEIIVAIGVNTSKKNMFSIEKRIHWIQNTFADCPNIKTISYEGLTIEACKKNKAKFILRGLRNTIDYEYEKNISFMNQSLNINIETVFLHTRAEFSAISSTIVRDIITNQGNPEPFLGSGVRL